MWAYRGPRVPVETTGEDVGGVLPTWTGPEGPRAPVWVRVSGVQMDPRSGWTSVGAGTLERHEYPPQRRGSGEGVVIGVVMSDADDRDGGERSRGQGQ